MCQHLGRGGGCPTALSFIIVMQSWPKLNIFHEYKSYVAGNGWSSHAHQLTANKLLSRAEAR